MMQNSPDDVMCYRYLSVTQPIGTFYVVSMRPTDLRKIAFFDIRRMEQRDVEKYLGIQRPLKQSRVEQLKQYVNTADASFPTSVIVAIDERCVYFHDNQLCLHPYDGDGEDDPAVPWDKVARVIDGQHRIDGLGGLKPNKEFEVLVTVFVGLDIADQAHVFSTVNLEQTKVNKSLAYDLYELARTSSPQKTCHNIAVTLDAEKDSPFYHRIKRLGVATEGREDETITQATFVQSLLRYISKDALADRNVLLSGGKLAPVSGDEAQKLIFRNMFIRAEDDLIADIVWNYFDAVRERWPRAWRVVGEGNMLNKTNGFKGLMRFLRPAYLEVRESASESVPTAEFLKIFQRVGVDDDYFTTENFAPGTSGESALFNFLLAETSVVVKS